jgi:DNA-binding IclR family transcriptional regulator
MQVDMYISQMSKTFLRGLDLIELVDLEGPLTISEIARRTGIELSIVSRTVAACEPYGWLVRVNGRIMTGPRCALLGLTSPATLAIRAAEPLVRAIAAAAGVTSVASALVGRETMVLASEMVSGAGPAVTVGVPSRIPLYVLADGHAIGAQLSPAQLDKLLPAEPYPGRDAMSPGFASAVADFMAQFPGPFHPEPEIVRTRAEFDECLRRVRAEGFSRDHGRLHASISCVARPWPAAGLPSAIACVASRDEIAARRGLIEACLAAATEPGATSQDVIRAAAQQAP